MHQTMREELLCISCLWPVWHAAADDLLLIGLFHKAHPNGSQHRLQILLRLRPYPMRGHWLLNAAADAAAACLCRFQAFVQGVEGGQS